MLVVAEEDLVNHEKKHQGMNRPVDVVTAARHGRQMSTGSYRNGCICRSTQ